MVVRTQLNNNENPRTDSTIASWTGQNPSDPVSGTDKPKQLSRSQQLMSILSSPITDANAPRQDYSYGAGTLAAPNFTAQAPVTGTQGQPAQGAQGEGTAGGISVNGPEKEGSQGTSINVGNSASQKRELCGKLQNELKMEVTVNNIPDGSVQGIQQILKELGERQITKAQAQNRINSLLGRASTQPAPELASPAENG